MASQRQAIQLLLSGQIQSSIQYKSISSAQEQSDSMYDKCWNWTKYFILIHLV